jgi:hypothetical protein
MFARKVDPSADYLKIPRRLFQVAEIDCEEGYCHDFEASLYCRNGRNIFYRGGNRKRR